MRNLLFMPIVFGFTAVAVFRPYVGVLFFTWLAFFYPQGYTYSTLPFSQIVALATMAGYFLSKEPKGLPLTANTILLLCLWAAFGFSTFFALYPDRAWERFMYVSKIFLMLFFTMSLLKDRSRLEMVLRVIALSIGFVGLKGALFVIATGGESTVWGPDGSFLRANNSIGLAMAMNVPLLYYLLRIETRPWLRKIMMAMLWGSYPAIICTYSRGAWLGLAMVTCLLFLRAKRRFLLISTVSLIALVGSGTLIHLLPERLINRYEQLENYEQSESAESRFWSWEFCKRVGLSRPLTGGGFDFPNRRLYAEIYPEFALRWGSDKTWSCHSTWLTVFGEHGFPGTIVWLALLLSCFTSFRSMRAYGRLNPEYSWMILLANAIQTSLFAYMVVGTFLDAAYFDMFYYLIGVVSIAKAMTRVGRRSEPVAVAAPIFGAGLPARTLTR